MDTLHTEMEAQLLGLLHSPTCMVLAAKSLSLPASLFGLTPDADAYWWEPGLPWASIDTPAARKPARNALEYVFATDEMGPRFRTGTTVLLQRVRNRAALRVGRVYVHLRTTENDEPQAGRLARIGDTYLELTQDHHSTCLYWQVGAGQRLSVQDLYEVTHYVECPSLPFGPKATRAWPPVADPTQLYLLEVYANDMGPRYPRGARYFTRLVLPEDWANSKGVHALRLIGGRTLLARLSGLSREHLVLVYDATREASTVALTEVVQLWKLGAADYLPEETEEEHLLAVQRPAY